MKKLISILICLSISSAVLADDMVVYKVAILDPNNAHVGGRYKVILPINGEEPYYEVTMTHSEYLQTILIEEREAEARMRHNRNNQVTLVKAQKMENGEHPAGFDPTA